MADSTLGLKSFEAAGAAEVSEREFVAAPDSASAMDEAVKATPPPVGERVKVRPYSRSVSINPFGLTRADLQRYLIIGVVGLLILFFLSQVAPILPPFVIAFLLASLLDPTVRHYERQGLPRVRTILMLYGLALAVLVIIGLLIVPRVATQLEDMSANFSSYTTVVQKNADTFLQKNAVTLRRFGIHQKRLSDLMNEKSGPVRTALNAFLDGLTDFVTSAASKLLWLIVIPVTSFFLLRDYPLIRARCIALVPDAYQDRVDFISRQIADVFSAYLRGLAKICTLFAIAASIMFWMLGIQDWLLLGLIGGMFYAVPYIGQLGTSTVVGAVSYSMETHTVLGRLPVSAHSSGYVMSVILCIIGLGIVFDQLVYPRVVGGSVGLHPVISIFAITAGATLFGVPGVLLAVPIAASIQVVVMCGFPRLRERPPDHLLEPQPPLA